jgi:hypothetical protein
MILYGVQVRELLRGHELRTWQVWPHPPVANEHSQIRLLTNGLLAIGSRWSFSTSVSIAKDHLLLPQDLLLYLPHPQSFKEIYFLPCSSR